MESPKKLMIVDIIVNTRITLEYEPTFWKNYIIDKLIELPKNCPLCKYTSISIIENNTINNPFSASCRNSH